MLQIFQTDIDAHNFLDFVDEDDRDNTKKLLSEVRHKNIVTEAVDIESYFSKI